ncbi:MAG: hypothetical protein HYV19_02520 [Gemmatimonadetes bacterium]|nr:hypothetical protein [Gemmatimonadota bacterium]
MTIGDQPVRPILRENASASALRQAHRETAVRHASLSALLPGLGQCAQGRYVDAALQFGTVVAYVGGVFFGLGGGRALLLALLWNAWSVVDAFRHEDAQP